MSGRQDSSVCVIVYCGFGLTVMYIVLVSVPDPPLFVAISVTE